MSTNGSSDLEGLDGVRQEQEPNLPKPWERQADESSKAFRAFQLYVSMDADRSAREVARKCTVHENVIKRWSARFSWVERARDYDEHMARTRFVRLATARNSVVDTQVRLCQKMLVLVEAAIARLAKRNRLSAADVSRMFNAITRTAQALWPDQPLASESLLGKSLPVIVLRKDQERDLEAEQRRGVVH